MFILMVSYLQDLDEVEKLMADHREYLEKHYREGTFVLSGRQVPRTGGFILAIGDDKDAITNITQTDPFVRAGVARYDVIQVAPRRKRDAERRPRCGRAARDHNDPASGAIG